MSAQAPVFIETMRVEDGHVPLLEIHADRLLWGIHQCEVSVDTATLRKHFMEAVTTHSSDLKGLQKLRCEFRIDKMQPIFSFSSTEIFSDCSGLKIGAYSDNRKAISFPWNAKTTDRALYESAMHRAVANGWDDAVVLNESGSVADAGIYCIFIWKDAILYTPPAADMPVRSVLKEWLMRNSVFPIVERSLSIQDLKEAELILLGNAVRWMQIGVWMDDIDAQI